MFGVNWADPQTLVLNLVNLGLGVLVLVCVCYAVIALVYEATGHHGRPPGPPAHITRIR